MLFGVWDARPLYNRHGDNIVTACTNRSNRKLVPRVLLAPACTETLDVSGMKLIRAYRTFAPESIYEEHPFG